MKYALRIINKEHERRDQNITDMNHQLISNQEAVIRLQSSYMQVLKDENATLNIILGAMIIVLAFALYKISNRY